MRLIACQCQVLRGDCTSSLQHITTTATKQPSSIPTQFAAPVPSGCGHQSMVCRAHEHCTAACYTRDIPNTFLQRTHSTTQCDCSDWYLGCKCKVTDQQPTLYHDHNQTSQHAVAQHCSAALGENTLHSLLQSPTTMALARGTRCIRHHRMWHIRHCKLDGQRAAGRQTLGRPGCFIPTPCHGPQRKEVCPAPRPGARQWLLQ